MQFATPILIFSNIKVRFTLVIIIHSSFISLLVIGHHKKKYHGRSFDQSIELVFRFNFFIFDPELYIFKKLAVYGYKFSGNSHHNNLKSNNECNR